MRSSVIGTWIGILPGIGANIGSVVAYTVAKNTSKHPEEFGHGCPDGIVASEAANNATVGGALIPLIAMGIPGSVIDVFLLGRDADPRHPAGAAAVHQQPRRRLRDHRRLPAVDASRCSC